MTINSKTYGVMTASSMRSILFCTMHITISPTSFSTSGEKVREGVRGGERGERGERVRWGERGEWVRGGREGRERERG